MTQTNKEETTIIQSSKKPTLHEAPTLRKSVEGTESEVENVHSEDEDEDSIEGCTFEETLQRLREKDKSSIPFFLFQPNTNQLKTSHNLLPPKKVKREYSLILDLDETLIHFEEKENGASQFLIRPYAQMFLTEMSKYYEIVIFTAAVQDYADYILDRMDTEKVVSHRLYRHHTSPHGNVYQKDLSKLGRDLSKTLIVDNNAENFQLQPDNGIYIKSWYDDPSDKALLHLAPLLIGTAPTNSRYCKKRV